MRDARGYNTLLYNDTMFQWNVFICNNNLASVVSNLEYEGQRCNSDEKKNHGSSHVKLLVERYGKGVSL